MPTVNSMVKKISAKKIVSYAPYQGIRLTEKGKKDALFIIRKHRLSELFLVKIMGLGWEEVHDIAEQLEHVNSPRFYDRIDEILGYPTEDPHGEPIPDANGKIKPSTKFSLNQLPEGKSAIIIAVTNDEKKFLDHLNSKGLQIGDKITLKKREAFDGSITIITRQKRSLMITEVVADKILVEEERTGS
jgi:DtxR family Mn-dependent transcriptional regulator